MMPKPDESMATKKDYKQCLSWASTQKSYADYIDGVLFIGQHQRISYHINHNDMDNVSFHDRFNIQKYAFHPQEATAYANWSWQAEHL